MYPQSQWNILTSLSVTEGTRGQINLEILGIF